MSRYTYTVFAQAYGEGVYNECDYNCQTTAGTSSGGNAGSPLADTGVMVVGIVTLACLIIFVALLTRAFSRGKGGRDRVASTHKQQPKPAEPPVQ